MHTPGPANACTQARAGEAVAAKDAWWAERRAAAEEAVKERAFKVRVGEGGMAGGAQLRAVLAASRQLTLTPPPSHDPLPPPQPFASLPVPQWPSATAPVGMPALKAATDKLFQQLEPARKIVAPALPAQVRGCLCV